MATELPEILTPGASNWDDADPEEERRARRESLDPDGLLTFQQREAMLEAEEDEQIRNEILAPDPHDDVETARAKTRERYATAAPYRHFVGRPCSVTGCNVLLSGVFYGDGPLPPVYCPRHRQDPPPEAEATLQCTRCGFVARSGAGLASHQRTHE